jgi:uncharacterized protein (DUF433 family)
LTILQQRDRASIPTSFIPHCTKDVPLQDSRAAEQLDEDEVAGEHESGSVRSYWGDAPVLDEPLIVRDPRICGGEAVIRGTRVPLRTILESLAEGDDFPSILRDFPTLTEQNLRAIVRFAAADS